MISIYNIVAAIWAFITIVSGTRYYNGARSGLLSIYASIFDGIYGLDLCKQIPSKNQTAPFKSPCNPCINPKTYPHGGDSSFLIHAGTYNERNCTAVAGVNGVDKARITNHGAPVAAINYITTILTGKSNGNVQAGQYDTTRFKQSTPYNTLVNHDPNKPAAPAIGYYYSLDSNKQEVPLIPPCVGPYTFPGSLQLYHPQGSYKLPDDWSAYVTTGTGAQQTCFSGLTQTKPTSKNSLPGYYYNNTVGHYVNGTYQQVKPYNNESGFGDSLSNSYFVGTSLNQTDNLLFKSYPQTAPSPTSSIGQLFR